MNETVNQYVERDLSIMMGIEQGKGLARIAFDLGITRQRVQQCVQRLVKIGAVSQSGRGEYKVRVPESERIHKTEILKPSVTDEPVVIAITLRWTAWARLKVWCDTYGLQESEVIERLIDNQYKHGKLAVPSESS